MRLLLFVFLLHLTTNLFAQRVNAAKAEFKNIIAGSLFYSLNNEPVRTKDYETLESGTPFFNDEWRKAYVVLSNNKVYSNISSRLNLLENTIHFLDEKGKEMIVNPEVKEIVFTESGNTVYFHFVHSSAFKIGTINLRQGWYQWLFKGLPSLYKYNEKTMEVRKNYGSASTKKFIHSKERYYILQSNALIEVRKTKDLIKIFPAHKNALVAKIKSLDDNLSIEEQLLILMESVNLPL